MSLRVRHPYLNARISLLADKLLPLRRLEHLIDLHAEEDYLLQDDNSSERVSLDSILSGQVTDLGRIDHSQFADLLDDFSVLVRPLSGAERDFMIYWLRKLEIGNIKAILRGKIAGLSNEVIRSALVDLKQYTSLPIDDLLRTEDTAEMLRRLEAAHSFSDIARQARQVYEKKRELFALEATIGYRYYAGVLLRAKAVEESEREPLVRLVSQLLERVNLVWLLRYRFTYQLSPAQTYYLLVPCHCRHLVGADLYYLTQLQSIGAVIARLNPETQARLENVQSITAIEQVLEEMVREEARRVLKQNHAAMARAFAYMLLRECQVNRILAVVKGRKLKLDTAVIRDGASFSSSGAGYSSVNAMQPDEY